MKKKMTSLAIALMAVLNTSAQVIAYQVETTTTAYEDITGGTVIDLQGTTGKDLSKVLFDNDGNISFTAADDVTAFPIGFDFGYDGKTMTHFLLTGDAAVLLFSEQTVTTDAHVVGTASPTYTVAGENSTNSFGAIAREGAYGLSDTEISYKLEGEAGSRVLVIQYKNLGWQSNAWDVPEEIAKAQIQYRLYEATGNIEMKVSGWKPYDGINVGQYNWARVGIVGNPKDWLFLTDFTTNNLSQLDAFISYNANSYPADGTTWTFVAPEVCDTPATPPSKLKLSSLTDQLSGTFTPGSADFHLVLLSTGTAVTGVPANKKKYNVGDKLGNATVAAIVSEGQFESAASLSASTDYHVAVYAFNSLCSAGPLYNATPARAHITTKPDAPQAVAISDIGQSTLSVSVSASTPVLVAITDVQGIDQWGSYMEYGTFGTPDGTYSAGDEISGGGRVIFSGSPSGAISVDGLESGHVYYVRAWSSDGQGGYSSKTADAAAVTVAQLPWEAPINERIGYEASLPGWARSTSNSYAYEWLSDADEPYLYCNLTGVDAENGTEAWIETPAVILAENTLLEATISGTARSGWMSGAWTLAEGEQIAFQTTTDGTSYKDVLVIDKDNCATLSGNMTPFGATITEAAGQTVRLRIYVKRFSNGQTRFGSLTLKEDDSATGISTVQPAAGTQGESTVYSLTGQRLSQLRKGLVISGGKKILVK